MCRYPSVSSHQNDITQLPRPQVALHLAEGDISMRQSGKHRLLWTGAWLYRHARGEGCAAVRRPVGTHASKEKILKVKLAQKATNKMRQNWMSFLLILLCLRTKQQSGGIHASWSVALRSTHFPLHHFLTCSHSSAGLPYVARSIQKLFNGPITSCKCPDKFSPLRRRT